MHLLNHQTYVGYVAVVRADVLSPRLRGSASVVVEHAHGVGSIILVAGTILAVFAFVVVEQIETQSGIKGEGMQVIHASKVRAVIQVI